MFNFNNMDLPEPYRFYLCKPNGDILYELNAIDESSASITINLNNQYELSFEYIRYITSNDGSKNESNGYHDIVMGMKILVDKIGYFCIKYPPYIYSESIEKKSIAASSCESELENKDLSNFKINMGTEDSLEYLVTYDDEETETLLNEYTGLPYDYIVFCNTFTEQLQTILNKYEDGTVTNSSSISEIKSFCDLIPRLKNKVIKDSSGNMSLIEYVSYTYGSNKEITSIYLSNFNARIKQLITFYTKYRSQLSLLDLAIEKCNCNWTIGSVDTSLLNKKFQFSVDENIYSFLTNDVASAAQCIFSFDLFKKVINVTLVENVGEDSSVIIDKQNLLNSLEVSCNEESITTRYNVSGGNNINISYVNFGDSRIEDISYFINSKDENGKRIYVDDSLAEKYTRYIKDKDIARDTYISLTKQYNQSLIDIDNLKYKVPNDSVQNDWDTFSDKELDASLQTYNKMLVTLESLYKEDYGTVGCNLDGSINESYIKKTEYWYDYYAYKQTIVQIEEAIRARANGERYADIDDETIKKKINAYKTEWSLYGIVELENKISAYNNSMKVLSDGESIILKSNSEIAKRWSELSKDEKTAYGNLESSYKYETYMNLYNEKVSCQNYLSTLNQKLKKLEETRDNTQKQRNNLVKLVSLEGYNRSELAKIVTLPPSSVSSTFTKKEVSDINLLYIDNQYSNDNILTTSLDNSVSEIDVEYELLNDAKEKLSIASQPQITFKADIDNLLCMSEFKSFKFNIGNYVTLQYYDDYYVKMRLYSMTFNPCIPNDSLSVTFTNYITSNARRNDVSYILGQSTNSYDSAGGSSSGGNGEFGSSNDIDVTISNTMLSKLLNTEMFGTRVSNVILDTIKVNEITSKYAKFEGLAKGTTIIDGKCITTGYIVDQYYNGYNGSITNNKGSVINLETGNFSFAGGRLKYDGKTLSFGSDVTLSWNQVTDTDDVANKDDIPTDVSQLEDAKGQKWSTTVGDTWIKTTSVVAQNLTVNSANINGKITANQINTKGLIAENISANTITGKELIGCTGTFNGCISVNNESFKINTDGSMSVGNGKFTIGTDGSLNINENFKVNYFGDVQSSGSLTAANGRFVIDSNGNIRIKDSDGNNILESSSNSNWIITGKFFSVGDTGENAEFQVQPDSTYIMNTLRVRPNKKDERLVVYNNNTYVKNDLNLSKGLYVKADSENNVLIVQQASTFIYNSLRIPSTKGGTSLMEIHDVIQTMINNSK